MAEKPRCPCSQYGRVLYRREGSGAVFRAVDGWAWCPTHGPFMVAPVVRYKRSKPATTFP